ncbi:hypothetical protein AncyloWKF20_20640 [Ancylobacter sp. WKF20]|uniref:hypothetical protein n=1 Tax=Ancylobacter sp. WKF20 TaxID=3039801 RepID=UPI0024345CDD|nr:hypothetical protein [Ancylobacter sp. WKF20]WGD30127.1 hypothetical protein AncyloWKF20_20640 [Ancylobacter sp. WKF20]
MTQNTELRARALCAVDLLAAERRPADLVAAVERYWPVVAREIEAGICDAGLPPPEDMERRAEEYRRLIG